VRVNGRRDRPLRQTRLPQLGNQRPTILIRRRGRHPSNRTQSRLDLAAKAADLDAQLIETVGDDLPDRTLERLTGTIVHQWIAGRGGRCARRSSSTCAQYASSFAAHSAARCAGVVRLYPAFTRRADAARLQR
jgi:hypothetical protein